MGRAEVQACRCTEKMGLAEESRPWSGKVRSGTPNSQTGYGGIGKGKAIMMRGEKELASDFSKRVITARTKRGWDKRVGLKNG